MLNLSLCSHSIPCLWLRVYIYCKLPLTVSGSIFTIHMYTTLLWSRPHKNGLVEEEHVTMETRQNLSPVSKIVTHTVYASQAMQCFGAQVSWVSKLLDRAHLLLCATRVCLLWHHCAVRSPSWNCQLAYCVLIPNAVSIPTGSNKSKQEHSWVEWSHCCYSRCTRLGVLFSVWFNNLRSYTFFL